MMFKTTLTTWVVFSSQTGKTWQAGLLQSINRGYSLRAGAVTRRQPTVSRKRRYVVRCPLVNRPELSI